MPVSSESAARDRVFDMNVDAALFAADWSNCDRIANYVANLVSQRRPDPLRYANLFSSVLNELLETAFRKHRAPGRIACAVYRGMPCDRIELSVPCDDATRHFYESAMAEASRTDVAERFVAALFEDGAFDPRLGLMGLVADYRARLGLDTGTRDRVTLTVDIALDDLVS